MFIIVFFKNILIKYYRQNHCVVFMTSSWKSLKNNSNTALQQNETRDECYMKIYRIIKITLNILYFIYSLLVFYLFPKYFNQKKTIRNTDYRQNKSFAKNIWISRHLKMTSLWKIIVTEQTLIWAENRKRRCRII